VRGYVFPVASRWCAAMTLNPDARDDLFKAFGRSFFKADLDALYDTVVTGDFVWTIQLAGDDVRILDTRQKIADFMAKRRATLDNVRFEDVVYHHAPDASFMTFRMTATDKATGAAVERFGVERYFFRDGRLAVKDVYTRAG
jgi:ketosteroid isomerase-like protein